MKTKHHGQMSESFLTAVFLSLSGGLQEYADRFVILQDGIDGRDNSVTFLNGLKLYAGQIHGNAQMVELQRRVQIRETIRTHLQRERELYPRGIKVLSLFFIDKVDKYRVYDTDSDDGRNGEYAKMFEEEYTALVSEMQRELGDDAYWAYLNRMDAHSSHQGYFSIDKKKGKKARFVEGKVDRKTQTSDDTDAYDLIMRDKERLLSLDEPVRFIFSHSALREGWDNPNVFQICTLKTQGESEIRSRQEIGRGLRLCVNQNGERMDESVLGSEVQELNKLTLITDMAFGKFATALQEGLAESMSTRPRAVDAGLFAGQILTDTNGAQVTITPTLATAIYEDLVQQGYVHRGALTDKYYAAKDAGTVQVAEEVQGCEGAVMQVLSSIYDPRALRPENAHDNNVQAKVDEQKLHDREFAKLWQRINRKTFYTVSFDTQELIDRSVRELDAHLNISKVSLGNVRYDLVGKLVEETGLTRATIASILQGIAPLVFAQYKLNPEDFIIKAGKIINNQKADMIIEHITYNRLEESYSADIFMLANLHGRQGVNAMPADRSLYNYVIYDSDNERRFAHELDVCDKIAVYVKLPGSFFISTPVGKYNPDWAIAFHEGTVKHIYFIAETKGTTLLDRNELRGVEDLKIQCAKAHFAAISNDSVVYDVVDSYDKLMQVVME